MSLPVPAGAAYARQSLAKGTLDGYRSAWDDFLRCAASPLPAAPNAVAQYLASLAATHGRSALRRRLSAIGQAHRLAGHPWDAKHPDIHHTLRGILRQHGRPPRQAAALTINVGERLSPHGLRSGFITAAYKAGGPDEVIMGHTRHKDHATMRRYVRRAGLIKDSPVTKLGL